MYIAYEAKKDSPMFSAFLYITLVQFYAIGVVIIYGKKILSKLDLPSEVNGDGRLWGISIGIAICLFSYFYYSRKGIYYYENLFSSSITANKYIKVWMLIVAPFLTFFLSIYIYIHLFGGEVFGKVVTGVWE
jgi:hypothetical protein